MHVPTQHVEQREAISERAIEQRAFRPSFDIQCAFVLILTKISRQGAIGIETAGLVAPCDSGVQQRAGVCFVGWALVGQCDVAAPQGFVW